MTVQLETCPFCGSTPRFFYEYTTNPVSGLPNKCVIECYHCSVKMEEVVEKSPGLKFAKRRIVERWNNREMENKNESK